MGKTSISQACRKDLYTPEADLLCKYPKETVEKIKRVRDMHQLLIANPATVAREIVSDIMERYGVTEQCAYSDLRTVRDILPTLTQSRRAYHRWQANEMMMETYRKARDKGKLDVMAKTAADYAKYNRVDEDDDDTGTFDEIRVQPFVPTMDPRVLGLEPIPDIFEKQRKLIEKYSREISDIEDVTYEEVDLQEDLYFPDDGNNNNSSTPDPDGDA